MTSDMKCIKVRQLKMIKEPNCFEGDVDWLITKYLTVLSESWLYFLKGKYNLRKHCECFESDMQYN